MTYNVYQILWKDDRIINTILIKDSNIIDNKWKIEIIQYCFK